jgi:hypothetical protein
LRYRCHQREFHVTSPTRNAGSSIPGAPYYELGIGWDALQSVSPDQKQSVIFVRTCLLDPQLNLNESLLVMILPSAIQPHQVYQAALLSYSNVILAKGLSPTVTYTVHVVDANITTTATGSALMNQASSR